MSEIPNAPGATPDVLSAEADVTPDYPTRCPDCDRPVAALARFPGGRCLDCHASITPMVTDARDLARIWGAS